MKTTGTIVYDPVHRVPAKQEIAYQRTAAQDFIGHLARLLPHKNLSGTLVKRLKTTLEAFIKDPYYWTRLGKDQAPPAAVKSFYELIEQVKTVTDDAWLIQDLNALETKMVKTETRPWTAIVKVDPQVTADYLKQLRSQGLKISQPAWGPHITWVRQEIPASIAERDFAQPPWGLYNGEKVNIEYNSEIQSNAQGHYWVNVSSTILFPYPRIAKSILDLREELGLKRVPKIPLHLTIGKLQ